MKTVQAVKFKNKQWDFISEMKDFKNPLVLVFGNRYLLESATIYDEIKELFPTGSIVFGSSSGEILGDRVYDESISLTAIEFEKSTFIVHAENVQNY